MDPDGQDGKWEDWVIGFTDEIFFQSHVHQAIYENAKL